MGAWGYGSFDNDDASDFLADVTQGGDASLLREAIDNVVTSTEYVEAPDACQALVAAEVIAAALGRSTAAAERQDGLHHWLVRVRPQVDESLVAAASDALARILAPNSELRELWEASDDFFEWRTTVAELRQQLRA